VINNIKTKERVKNTLSFDNIIDKLILWSVIISLLIFILYPIIMVISTSFYSKGLFTLSNYKNLINPKNLKLIKNSIFVVTLSSFIGVIISTSIALFAFMGKWKSKIYKGMLLAMISPPFVSSIALITLFGRRGLITYNLLGLSVNPYGWKGIVLLQSLGKIPLGVIMLVAAINAIDQRHILASRDLGATSFETLKNILIPGIFPTILAVLFLNFTMNLADFGTPIIIGGKFKMLATETYMTIFSSGDLGKAAAMSVLLIPPAIIAFTFYKKNMDNINNKSEGSKALGSSNYKFDVPVALKYLTGFITISFFGITILKYGTIFLTAISMNASGKLIFTLDHIKKVKVSNLPAVMRSIYFAIVAGVVSSVIGILLSYYTHRRKIWGMKYIEFISALL
jgi:iron(III) transport system permease protein